MIATESSTPTSTSHSDLKSKNPIKSKPSIGPTKIDNSHTVIPKLSSSRLNALQISITGPAIRTPKTHFHAKKKAIAPRKKKIWPPLSLPCTPRENASEQKRRGIRKASGRMCVFVSLLWLPHSNTSISALPHHVRSTNPARERHKPIKVRTNDPAGRSALTPPWHPCL